MEYLAIENWETIRSLLGVLICLVSILCMRPDNSHFHKALKKELPLRQLKKIQKQVQRLKEENQRAHSLLHKIDQLALMPADETKTTDATRKPEEDKGPHQTFQQDMALQNIDAFEGRTTTDPYEKVRQLAASGMHKEEIYQQMNIPKAEIDLMLKFNHLAKVTRLKEQQGQPLRAYG